MSCWAVFLETTTNGSGDLDRRSEKTLDEKQRDSVMQQSFSCKRQIDRLIRSADKACALK